MEDGIFDTKLFGYDKDQVDNVIHTLERKIILQQRDIDYLREENKRKTLEQTEILEK